MELLHYNSINVHNIFITGSTYPVCPKRPHDRLRKLGYIRMHVNRLKILPNVSIHKVSSI